MTMFGKVCTVSVVLLAAVLASSCAARVPGSEEGATSRHAWTDFTSHIIAEEFGKVADEGPFQVAPLGPAALYPGGTMDHRERQLEPSEVYERIINGDIVDSLSRAPYVAILVVSVAEGLPTFCTGVVVARDVILLAAHCVTFDDGSLIDKSVFNVCAGLTERSPENLAEKCLPVESVAVPDEYTGLLEDGFDIAAVRVQGNLKRVGAEIATVSMQRRFRQRVGTEGFLRGWGATQVDRTEVAEELRETDVQLFGVRGDLEAAIDDVLCQGDCGLDFDFFDLAFGDFDGSQGGGCSGDSGGPVIVQEHVGDIPFDEHVVVGVVSFGFIDSQGRCLLTPGTFFTRFSHPPIRKFIKKTARNWGRTLRIVS